MPYGKLALLFVDVEHRVDDVRLFFRMYDCHKRQRSAVCVPEGECSVIREIRTFVYLSVGSAVISVYVAENRRGYHCVIQARVEHFACICVLGGDFYFRKFLLPFPLGSFCGCLEIPARHLSFHVGLCAFHAYRRKGDLEEYLLVL